MKPMRSFYIITNYGKDPGLQNAEKLKSFLVSKGAACVLHVQNTCTDEDSGFLYTDPNDVPSDTDCVIVLGGDGTLLQAARDLVDRSFPLLGINMGTLGYLAEIELANAETALLRVLEGKCQVENRMMLHGAVYRKGEERPFLENIAFNDIVLIRRGRLRVVDYQISVDGTVLCSYRADGIICSTPTGSTGYSLSAGGPIVSPDASLMLLTAVAPHTLNSRTIILPDHVKIDVELGGDPMRQISGADVTFDGTAEVPMMPGDRVEIRKSGRQIRLVRVYNTSFVENLRIKMN